MKKNFLVLLILMTSIASAAQTLSPTDAGSAVKFTIKNFGLNVGGTVKGIKGKINFIPANLAVSSFAITLDAATINTGNTSRDGHLKKDDYLDVAKFPTLQFISTKVTAGEQAGKYNLTGLLTIKGIEKGISFPFTATPTAAGYQFAGSFTINRRDFKVGGNSLILSDNLNVSLNISASK